MHFTHRNTTKIATIGVAALLALAVGCDVEVEGEEGNFTFSYLNSQMTTASDLAEGAKVDVRVIDADTEEPVELAEVFTEDAGVLDVVDRGDHHFTLEAKATGTVRVTAEAEVDGDAKEISDSFEVRSAEVSSVELDNRCGSGLFVTDAAGRMKYQMFDTHGEELTGYGYYPVSVEPGDDLLPLELEDAGEINEDHSHLGSLEFFVGSEPGTYAIVSELTDESEEFEAIAPSDIDELKPAGGGEATGSVDVGETQPHAAVFILESAGEEVCGPLDDVLEITNETPEVCDAEYFLTLEDMGALAMHSLAVDGLDSGICELNVAVVDTEVSLDVEVEVN